MRRRQNQRIPIYRKIHPFTYLFLFIYFYFNPLSRLHQKILEQDNNLLEDFKVDVGGKLRNPSLSSKGGGSNIKDINDIIGNEVKDSHTGRRCVFAD